LILRNPKRILNFFAGEATWLAGDSCLVLVATLKGEQMTFKSKMMVGLLTMLVFFAMATSSFAQVSISLIPDPSAGEIQTNNNAQTASPGVSGAGILISGSLIANSPLTTTSLRITYPSPITSSPTTFNPLGNGTGQGIPAADPIRIEGATGVFASVSNPVLNTENSRIEIQLTGFPSLSGGNSQSGSFRLVGVRIDANGKSGAQTATASLNSSANNYILVTTSVTVINAIGNGIGTMAIGGRALNGPGIAANATGNNGSATIFTNRTLPDANATIVITEGFASAFRTALQSSNSGAAVNNGTNIRLTFNGIPSGVTLTLTGNAGGNTSSLALNGAAAPVAPASVAIGTVTASANTATIQFTGTATANSPSLTATDQVEIQVVVSQNSTSAVTTAGAITVTATLVPIDSALNNDNTTALGLPKSTNGYPTFTQLDVGPVTVVNIVPASTTMLIPLAERVGVFDTGISVANTTSDPFGAGGGGATASAGTLRFDIFPSTATGAGTACFLQTSATSRPGVGIASDGTIPAGATYLVLLSQLLPLSNCAAGDFFGYIFVTANFLNAHGQATISDFRTYSLATNVLVMPPPSTTPRSSPGGSVEALHF
jgi:hypothetical protein